MTRLFIVFVFISSCSKKNEETPPGSICSTSSLETLISQKLDTYSTDTDFTFYVERDDGKSLYYNKGTSTLSTVYESASTSKWVSAVVILWAVENIPGFDLSGIVADHYSWSMDAGDNLYNATLSQLLSFTSGLEEEANCLTLGIPIKSFDGCINDSSGSIVSENEGSGNSPGASFYYSSSHLQVAGAMAVQASSSTTWEDLFNSFKADTGLFFNSDYSLPRTTNPRLAGGMTWTGEDYVNFLKAIYKNQIFSQTLRDEMLSDQVSGLTIEYSPAFNGLGEQWHYGLGVWLECRNTTFNCPSVEYYSSPGAYGAYPFLNLKKSFFGIVARQGSLGTYVNGVNLYRNIQVEVEAWASCQN